MLNVAGVVHDIVSRVAHWREDSSRGTGKDRTSEVREVVRSVKWTTVNHFKFLSVGMM